MQGWGERGRAGDMELDGVRAKDGGLIEAGGEAAVVQAGGGLGASDALPKRKAARARCGGGGAVRFHMTAPPRHLYLSGQEDTIDNHEHL